MDTEPDGFSRRWRKMRLASFYGTWGSYSCYCSSVSHNFKLLPESSSKKLFRSSVKLRRISLPLTPYPSFTWHVNFILTWIKISLNENFFYNLTVSSKRHFCTLCGNSFCLWLHWDLSRLKQQGESDIDDLCWSVKQHWDIKHMFRTFRAINIASICNVLAGWRSFSPEYLLCVLLF